MTLVGAVLGFMGITAFAHGVALGELMMGTTFDAILGASFGQARAFTFRLLDQQALWQLSVEQHLARMASAIDPRPK